MRMQKFEFDDYHVKLRASGEDAMVLPDGIELSIFPLPLQCSGFKRVSFAQALGCFLQHGVPLAYPHFATRSATASQDGCQILLEPFALPD
jgi:hypothetical protein